MLDLRNRSSLLGASAYPLLMAFSLTMAMSNDARGQSLIADSKIATGGEPRYSQDAPTTATVAEPLLSYRRDDAGQDDGAGRSANPLRPPLQPSTQPHVETAQELLPTRRLAATGQPLGGGSSPASVAPQGLNNEAALDAAASEGRSTPLNSPDLAEAIPAYDQSFALASHSQESTSATPAAIHPPLTEDIPRTATLPLVVDENRRLAPRSSNGQETSQSGTNHSRAVTLPFSFSKLQSLSSAGAGLAIVVGLFLVTMVLLRRGGGKATGGLPTEAFAVLGRTSLTPTNSAHLLRIGSKLVLVAVSADGAHPLTEVTDPLEVDRISGLCASSKGYGPAAEFHQVLAQLAREPARGFLGAEASSSNRRRC